MSADDSVSRRGFMRAATGTAAAAGVAGSATGTAAAQSTKEVKVGPGGKLTFEPAEVYVKPGSKVKWVWESDTHNVVPDKKPSGASWSGSEGAPSKLFDSGHSYTHTFETTGEYTYFCQPHKTSGMTGKVIVNESGSAPSSGGGGGGGGGGPPSIPDSAKMLSLATSFGMVSTLGLAYFFVKYGGDYRDEP